MLRQENISIDPASREFRKLYNPLGKRYLRGMESYLYHKDKPPTSEAQRQMGMGINPLGVRPVNIQLPLPANANKDQMMDWIIRTQALKNPRVDTGARPAPFHSGQQTGGVNREMVERNNVGVIYSEAKIASTRTQKVLPVY